tara:strand:- start:56 stop:874 length:819 start_codon:yes stop_codon:yes gene_type:complete
MEDYFNDLNFDKTIGLIGFILTALSLIYAFTESRRNKLKKIIKLNRGQTFSVFKNNPSLKTDELKLMWKNKQVGNIFLIEIFLKNYGNISLEKKDFLKPILISFQKDVELLKTQIYSTSEFTKLNWKSNNNEIRIDVDLFEKKKMIKAEIIYTNEMVSPTNIDIAILDGNIENVELKAENTSDNTDREMDAKSYSISLYGALVLTYFLGSLLIPAALFFVLKYYEILPSDLTKILIFSPFAIIGLYQVGKKYSEGMAFIDKRNKWVEFKSEN